MGYVSFREGSKNMAAKVVLVKLKEFPLKKRCMNFGFGVILTSPLCLFMYLLEVFLNFPASAKLGTS